MTFDTHTAIDYATRFVFSMSVLNLLLPPWETFNDFPGFQKKYKLYVNIVSRYGALNMRSQVNSLYSSYKNGGTNGSTKASSSVAPSAPNTPVS